MAAFGVDPGDWIAVTERLLAAATIGGAIGWNRQIHGKAAGLRTHMLVSLGAGMFVLMPLLVGESFSAEAMSRTIQGVATGVGFLGAGEIVHQSRTSQSPKVKGLTSAASIWVTAALGMMAACGLWQPSLIGTGIVLVILAGAKRLERFIPVQRDED